MTDLTSPPPAAAGAVSAQERQWGMAAHLSALAGFIIPFGSVLGPLVVWLIKKEEMPFVNDQGKEALNFNIMAGIIVLGLIILTVGTFGIGALLTVPLGVALGLVWLIFTIMAAIKANEGVSYRYPINLRLVK
ncbi:MAG: DUF4870 domain-containing protein [Steroidobacteraceae bacterium]|nr:DUF4870 domain-containing protein [Steroidobacteraceae bacterium]